MADDIDDMALLASVDSIDPNPASTPSARPGRAPIAATMVDTPPPAADLASDIAPEMIPDTRLPSPDSAPEISPGSEVKTATTEAVKDRTAVTPVEKAATSVDRIPVCSRFSQSHTAAMATVRVRNAVHR